MWRNLNSEKISDFRCEHSGLLLQEVKLMSKSISSVAMFTWNQLLTFHRHNLMIVHAILRLNAQFKVGKNNF